MIHRIPIEKILFLDIETASVSKDFEEMGERMKYHWSRKAGFWAQEYPVSGEEAAALFQSKAGIFAEFAKVICISAGFVFLENAHQKFRVKSFYGDDEKKILLAFSELLNSHFSDPAKDFLCGHNIREFDIPFLCRRMLIHEIELPALLDVAGRKPWELKYLLDTMELWKFGDYKHFTSLDLLAEVLNVQSPKQDIDGSMVGRVYWEERDLTRIAEYCEGDVVTVAQVVRRMRREPQFDYDDILSVTDSDINA